MSDYKMTWITNQLAVGYAPMSYAELDSIRAQGIDAIVNLCGEFCDLHQIEEGSGFEVCYLPVHDDCAPDMELLEKALAWMDEAFYLNKKVLVHCRHGHGRTGTFVSAYLLRRGMGLKVTEKSLERTGASPSSYQQWKLLKKYCKKAGMLTVREPSLENRRTVDLGNFFAEYEALLRDVDQKLEQAHPDILQRFDAERCCKQYFELSLIESIYVSRTVNKMLKSEKRLAIIKKAQEVEATIRQIKRRLVEPTVPDIEREYAKCNLFCPLSKDGGCLIYPHRPMRCRRNGLETSAVDFAWVTEMVNSISRNVFVALAGEFPPAGGLAFSLVETVSGRFVQTYFNCLTGLAR